ncbi:MAG: diadenylate cyclase CdaA [Lachnospiraceae bacterium]|nr:diadenylate cyclase CdaA [Lachnospiraceae bacterium]MBR4992715.1 diadenylate cyclase CdaA [Lachnospiraceae bacterium]MBR5944496.1 diadenylate cyclase CdaA [Lachnospiraceae bacterium]
MEQLAGQVTEFIGSIRLPLSFEITDIVEMLIISYLVYHIMIWIKNTRAWILMKGLAVILAFMLLAVVFNMQTILWIVRNVLGFAITALIVVLQPELRKALEELGRKNLLSSVFLFDSSRRDSGITTDKTITEIVKACMEMARAKTGALIVIEGEQKLKEFESTGIDLDAVVSSQLLINIFEHNTPLHDGAIVISGNRVTSATCYLPLSDNKELSKDLGTRHRAGVGVSEVTDSLTIIVSEETGKVSVALEGNLERSLNAETLTERLRTFCHQNVEEIEKKRFKWPGRSRHEKEADK